MPRASDGTVTLVSGATAVTGQTISSTDHNSNMSDIASMLQDSLSRSGKGGMTAPMQFADGSSASPSITFANSTNAGLFRYAADKIGMAVKGALMMLWDATIGKVTITGDLEVTGSLTVGGTTSSVSTLIGAFTVNTSAAETYVTGSETPAITCNGRPLLVTIQPDPAQSACYISNTSGVGGTQGTYYRLQRSINGGAYTSVAITYIRPAAGLKVFITLPPVVDSPGAGSIKYKLMVQNDTADADNSVSVIYQKVSVVQM